MATGQVYGDIRFASLPATKSPPETNRAFMTLLTLDVKAGRPNNPVTVQLNFFAGVETLHRSQASPLEGLWCRLRPVRLSCARGQHAAETEHAA